MKKLAIAAIFAATTLMSLSATASEGIFSKRIRGNGNKIIENRQSAMQFSKVIVNTCIHLVVSDRRDGDILVRTDENIMPYVKMEVRNGVFRAWLDNTSSRDMENVRIDIEMPYNGMIREIEAYAASSVTVVPQLKAGEVELTASGASFIRANIHSNSTDITLSGASSAEVCTTTNELEISASGASKVTLSNASCKKCDIESTGASKVAGTITTDTCDIEASGASKVTLTGVAHHGDFEISGASKLDASKLVTEICSVEATGASAAYVHCTTTLSAEASGSSKIGYSGDCRVNVASDAIFKQK